jgi:hypothetical protein
VVWSARAWLGKPDSADELPAVNGAKPPETQKQAVEFPAGDQEQAPAETPAPPPAPNPRVTWAREWGANALRYIWCYGSWFLLSGFSLWILIELRVALLTLITYVRLQVVGVAVGETVSTGGQLRAADQWIVLVLALGWLGFVVWLEAYLRAGTQRGTFWPRLARVTIWLVVLLGVAYGLEEIFTRL